MHPSERGWVLLASLVIFATSSQAVASDEQPAHGSWATVLGGSVQLTGTGDIVVPAPADHFEFEFEYLSLIHISEPTRPY